MITFVSLLHIENRIQKNMIDINKSRELAEKIAEKRFKLAGVSTRNDEFRKVLLAGETKGLSGDFAGAQVVNTPEAIIEDSEIDLVFMPESEQHKLEIVSQILNSGKSLRIV